MKRLLIALLLLGALGLLYLEFGDEGERLEMLPVGQPADEMAGDSTTPGVVVPLQSSVRGFAEQRESLSPVAAASESAADSLIYSVHVEVRRSENASFDVAPGVKVQLGVALGNSAAFGRLRSGKVELLETEADDQGSVTVELVIPAKLLGLAASDKSSSLLVWASVSETGYCQVVSTAELPDDEAEVIEIQLNATVGGTIHGQLLLANGTPASSGRTLLCTLNEELGVKRTLSGKPVFGDGHFTIHYFHKGPRAVHAWANGFGAVTSEVLSLDFGEPVELELTLQGAGFIAGRVVGEDGEGYANYSLLISLHTREENSFHKRGLLDQVRRQWSGGLTNLSVSTDENGAFRFGGLQHGAYEIRGMSPPFGVYENLMTSEPVHTDQEDLQFMIAGCRLLVHVLDAAGQPVKSLGLTQRGQGVLDRQLTLYCEPCDTTGRLLSTSTSSSKGRSRLENGAVVLDVEAGKSYVVGVVSKANHLEELIVHIPHGEARSERTLQLRAPATPTSLNVKVLTPDGQPYRGNLQVGVFSPDSGKWLAGTESWHGSGEFNAQLGPGLYRVRVSAEPQRDHHGYRTGAAPYAVAEQLVELHGGQENRFEIGLVVRGWLELSTDVEPGLSLPAFELAPGQTRSDEEPWRLHNLGVRVQLEPVAGGPVTHVEFEVQPAGLPVTYFTQTEEPWFRLGETAKSFTPVPIGEYTLILSPPGFREICRLVTIEEGETTKLKFTLTQQDLRD